MGAIPIRQATPECIEAAADHLRNGELVVFPTETVYGLGADATNARAVNAIFTAKGRPANNPLISHVADMDTLRRIAEYSLVVEALAEAFWPGALTLVLKKSVNCPVDPVATAELETIAVRMPAHETALALLRAFGGPVVAPSANISGQVSPTRAEHVQLTDERSLTLILDAGPCSVGLESTIVSLTGPVPVLLRPGGITKSEIEAVIGPVQEGPKVSAAPSAPGQLESHYAPDKPVCLNVQAPNKDEAFLGFGPEMPQHGAMLNLSPAGDLSEAAANLYDYLRKLDETECRAIAVAPIPDTGIGRAINDRLTRAAAPRPTKKA